MGQATDLKQYTLDYVNAVRRRPQLGSDPNELDNLESAALTSFQGAFSALHAPIAPMSWEARTLFLSAAAVSERIQMDIPFPCMMVGTFPSVEPVGANGGLVVPTTQSIDVSLDLNNHEYMTQAQGTTTPVIGGAQSRDIPFSTLASLGVNGGQRLLAWVIPYRTAQLGITFRWKQGANVYQSSQVGLVFYARALQES
jgi:hypothetical protein